MRSRSAWIKHQAILQEQHTPQTAATTDLNSRKIVLERRDWIEGVLDKTLDKVVRQDLRFKRRPDAVAPPLNALVQVGELSPEPLGDNIPTVFANSRGGLLILGSPGAGKTTLLLKLLSNLLQKAMKDATRPIPMMFNLSSWSPRRGPLVQWLIHECNRWNDVTKRLARKWVEADQILPLLDGLDEVDGIHRQACVEAINDFRRERGLQMVVCSRIDDYEPLTTKLHLRQAILVQPLTPLQAENYLNALGKHGKHLRAAVQSHTALLELWHTPLMMSVAALAYKDAEFTAPVDDNRAALLKDLFSTYVQSMFRRRPAADYTPALAERWLSWLASALMKNHRTVFYLEDIGNFVPSVLVAPVTGFIGGLVVGLSGGLAVGLNGGPSSGLIIGLFFGLVGGLISVLLCNTSRAELRAERLSEPRGGRTGHAAGIRNEVRAERHRGIRWAIYCKTFFRPAYFMAERPLH
jgi:hypothetical protein